MGSSSGSWQSTQSSYSLHSSPFLPSSQKWAAAAVRSNQHSPITHYILPHFSPPASSGQQQWFLAISTVQLLTTLSPPPSSGQQQWFLATSTVQLLTTFSPISPLQPAVGSSSGSWQPAQSSYSLHSPPFLPSSQQWAAAVVPGNQHSPVTHLILPHFSPPASSGQQQWFLATSAVQLLPSGPRWSHQLHPTSGTTSQTLA